MEPERRCKSGMDGGLRAAVRISPLLHLKTDGFLSNRWGPLHKKAEQVMRSKRNEDEKSDNKVPLEIWFCSPLHVRAQVRNAMSAQWGYLVEFKDPDRRLHSLTIAAN